MSGGDAGIRGRARALQIRAAVAVAHRRRPAQADAPGYEQIVRRYAPGRSFADIGTMWTADGETAFVAEEAGAKAVTAFDGMERTAEFDAKRERRAPGVRFVQGDINDLASAERIGRHDVVWCTGVLYHAPNPIQTLTRLAAITGELLIVGTKTAPESLAGRSGALFLPGLNERERRAYSHLWGPGMPPVFNPAEGYENWWWALTPSGFTAIISQGMEVVETIARPYGSRDDFIVVARRR